VLRFAPILLLALALGGASAAASGQAPATGESVAILAMGDFGNGGARERDYGQLVRRFEARHPADWFVPLGDNDYTMSAAAFRRNWAGAFGWLRRAGVTVSGVLGNHDVEVQNGDYELRTLGMPAHYYTRTVGDLQLFMLDSNDVHSPQTQWLGDELARSSARWKIAFFHHPPYSCGKHSGDEDVVRRWVPLFERYGVQLVLTAHEHSYQRFVPQNGVLYVVHGGGGSVLYRLRACPDSYPGRIRARVTHGFVYLVLADDQLDGYVHRFSGKRIDHFVVTP
jgi:hypothetical protein